jgi:hypothetical protein
MVPTLVEPVMAASPTKVVARPSPTRAIPCISPRRSSMDWETPSPVVRNTICIVATGDLAQNCTAWSSTSTHPRVAFRSPTADFLHSVGQVSLQGYDLWFYIPPSSLPQQVRYVNERCRYQPPVTVSGKPPALVSDQITQVPGPDKVRGTRLPFSQPGHDCIVQHCNCTAGDRAPYISSRLAPRAILVSQF